MDDPPSTSSSSDPPALDADETLPLILVLIHISMVFICEDLIAWLSDLIIVVRVERTAGALLCEQQ